jgi:NTP pyrophosphatase (non-canonical NTP hydrolase)
MTTTVLAVCKVCGGNYSPSGDCTSGLCYECEKTNEEQAFTETHFELESKRAPQDLNELARRVLAVCKHRGWSLHWESRSAQLHGEASELMDAVRGKRGVVLEEAGDVLFCLMAVTEHAKIPFTDVTAQTERKATTLLSKPRYKGEEFNDPELEQQVYEAFKDRGWIMPTTEEEVARAEALVHQTIPGTDMPQWDRKFYNEAEIIVKQFDVSKGEPRQIEIIASHLKARYTQGCQETHAAYEAEKGQP